MNFALQKSGPWTHPFIRVKNRTFILALTLLTFFSLSSNDCFSATETVVRNSVPATNKNPQTPEKLSSQKISYFEAATPLNWRKQIHQWIHRYYQKELTNKKVEMIKRAIAESDHANGGSGGGDNNPDEWWFYSREDRKCLNGHMSVHDYLKAVSGEGRIFFRVDDRERKFVKVVLQEDGENAPTEISFWTSDSYNCERLIPLFRELI